LATSATRSSRHCASHGYRQKSAGSNRRSRAPQRAEEEHRAEAASRQEEQRRQTEAARQAEERRRQNQSSTGSRGGEATRHAVTARILKRVLSISPDGLPSAYRLLRRRARALSAEPGDSPRHGLGLRSDDREIGNLRQARDAGITRDVGINRHTADRPLMWFTSMSGPPKLPRLRLRASTAASEP
jgi:hypothetical protein